MEDKQYQWNADSEFKITGKQLELFLTAETILKSKELWYREFQFLDVLAKEIGDIFETNKDLLKEVVQERVSTRKPETPTSEGSLMDIEHPINTAE